jgi:ATP-dependent exoDNAse (exonuclease V) beta subunit
MSETSIPDVAARAASTPDETARRHALDPAHSFIVQAPAGAGKTELLTQRFLRLLATVDRPEEILAITFTIKAAAEMRGRVLDALARAADETPPTAAHERRTWELARAARARDAERGWHIAANPGRLAIQTIDAFCLALTRQMPLLARFGAPPAIVEDATEMYRDAARAVLASLQDDDAGAPAVERLLRHLDNNFARSAEMLADMLARRDQWLRHIVDRRWRSRATLEEALAHVLRDALAELAQTIPAALAGEIVLHAAFAAEQLEGAGTESPIRACRGRTALPAEKPGDLDAWLGVAELLLTREGAWRRSVTKKQGFAGKGDGATAAQRQANDAAKQRVLALIEQLADYPDFREQLHALRELPPACYSDEQWEALQTLLDVLPLAAAHLKRVFAERATIDFTEIMQGALHALGEPEAPTDLLLALDYRLKHVLVDEFQDTSVSQYELLTRLTAGWTPGDGRTLFLVGDPMQSIYRFREAEVGLYLRATHEGIGGTVALTKLTLSANFRSQAGIVDWVNHGFARIFPAHEEIGAGAVRYAACEAVRPRLPGPAVVVHPAFGRNDRAEADQVVALVQAARREQPDGSTAILVRTREHLAAIVAQLKRAGLSFRAIEIERLAERQAVQDLLTLTRALLHPADRSAWLALLRAPWCGLTLADLHALVGDERDAAVWDLMRDETRVARLSVDGRRRMLGARAVLATAFAQRGRARLRRHVEAVWLALGGPACVEQMSDLADIDVYLQLLDELDEGLVDLGVVAQRAAKLFAAPDLAADDRLQIMTIHKAKGLEFDTVIVPGLGRRPRGDTAQLLTWTERTRGHGEPDLLLAPIQAVGADGDPIASYLRTLERARERNEDLRLLYVAATRARQRLHLLGHVNVSVGPNGPELTAAAAGSLLNGLWPAVEPVYAAAFAAAPAAANVASAPPDWSSVQELRRLAFDWSLPVTPAGVDVPLEASVSAPDTAIEFEWVGDTARRVGEVVHRWLLHFANDGLGQWSAARVGDCAPALRQMLAQLGVPAAERDAALAAVGAALINVLDDERAQWLFGPWSEARSEYPLSGVLDGRVVNVVLDRTFVDNDGVRWIVDYKTSAHAGGEREAFLDSEQQRYAAQLARYARLLAKREARPVKLGLYFPLLRGWREWEFRDN